MAEASSVPEDVVTQVSAMELKDDMGSPLKVSAVTALDATRRATYARVVPELSVGFVVAVQCTDESEEATERIVHVSEDKSTAKDIVVECKISLEMFPPTELVEYKFSESGHWLLAQMSLASLEYFRGGKFKIWRQMLLEMDCEAALKRMLKEGLINRVFGALTFPSPESEKAQWEVKDKRGETVHIPRPVYALRVYNATTKAYDSVSPMLDGAPTDDEKDDYWNGLLSELKTRLGEEYINECLAADDSVSAMTV